MTTDPGAHASPDQDNGPGVVPARFREGSAVRGHQLGQRIGPPRSLHHVTVIEGSDSPQFSEQGGPMSQQRVRRRRPRTRGQEEKRRLHFRIANRMQHSSKRGSQFACDAHCGVGVL